MKTYNQFINEGVRDLMIPKSEEEIQQSLSKLSKEKVFDIFLKFILQSEFDLIHQFIKYGYDINIRNDNNETLLMELCKTYYLKNKLIERFVTEFNADINLKDRNNKTALIHAVDYDRIENLKTLIKLGVNLKKHNQGAIALIRAVANNKNLEIIQSLINAGADVNYIDHNDSTPLIYAALQSRVQIVELLLSKGVDVNIRNENGMSALMVAATRDSDSGSNLIIKMLLDAGADINLKNNNHQTAIDCALAWKRESNANLIRNYKSKINEGVRDKMTPKSENDIKKSLDKLTNSQKIEKIFRYNLQDKFTRMEIMKMFDELSPIDRVNKIFSYQNQSIFNKEKPYFTQKEIDQLVPEFVKLTSIDNLIHFYNVSDLIKKELKKELLKMSALKQLEYISIIKINNLEELYTEEELKELKEKASKEANEYKSKGEINIYHQLIGKVAIDIKVTDNSGGYDEIKFTFSDGDEYTMYHNGDQADINIEDINGDIEDLIGVPLLVAEEVTSTNPSALESGTWTFYKFATIKGYVDIRWYGTSNGYYCENAVFKKTK
jgi:ankyrin repeat protein